MYLHYWRARADTQTRSLKQTLCHCCPFSSALESVGVIFLFINSFSQSDTTGVACFTGHFIVWHMGFTPLLCPTTNVAKWAGSEWSSGVWCRFHHVQLPLMLPSETGVPLELTGPPGSVLGQFVVCWLSVQLLVWRTLRIPRLLSGASAHKSIYFSCTHF